MKDLLQYRHSQGRNQLILTDEYCPTDIKKSYCNTSQVKGLLNEAYERKSQQNVSFQTKKVYNPITQQNKSLIVPKMSVNPEKYELGKINLITSQYDNWYSLNKKFSKPYSECSKYIDNLSQHKTLIRRGPFNIPVDKGGFMTRQTTFQLRNDSIQHQASTKQHTFQSSSSKVKSLSHNFKVNQSKLKMQYRSVFKQKDQTIYKSQNNLKNYGTQNRSQTSKSVNKFDKSLQNCVKNYKNLMRKQRFYKQEEVVLKNSMNKIVAVDSINQKLLVNNVFNKINFQKIQKRFKKKLYFLVESQK